MTPIIKLVVRTSHQYGEGKEIYLEEGEKIFKISLINNEFPCLDGEGGPPEVLVEGGRGFVFYKHDHGLEEGNEPFFIIHSSEGVHVTVACGKIVDVRKCKGECKSLKSKTWREVFRWWKSLVQRQERP